MQSKTLTDYEVLKTIVESKLVITKRIQDELDLLSDAPNFIVKAFLQAYQFVIIEGNEPLPINECDSMIAYELKITTSNPGRNSCHYPVAPGAMPDIDTDYANPDFIKDYVREKYGEDKVINIPTYSRYKVRSLLKELCRVVTDENGDELVPFAIINELTKKLPFKIDSQVAEDMAEDNALDDDEDSDDNDASYEEIFSNKDILQFGQKYPSIFQHFKILYSQPKNKGTHAAGLVITPTSARDIIPLSRIKKKISAEFVEGQGVAELGSLGFVKIDVLGLKTLKMLDTCNELIMKNYDLPDNQPSPCACYKQQIPCESNYLMPFMIREGTNERLIDFNKVCLNIPKIYKRLAEGQTEGVFQFEPDGVSSYMNKFEPKNINDLALITAAYRPGLMDLRLDTKGEPIDIEDPNFQNGVPGHMMLIKRRKKQSPVIFPSEKVENILQKTSGLAVYQEHLSQMIMAMTGGTFSEAEKIRKFLTKEKPENLKSNPETIAKVKSFYAKFKDSSLKNGCNLKEIDAVWNLILPFARYGFCAAHAVSYALISYQTAFCRILFPKEYLTALMYHNVGVLVKGRLKVVDYIRAAQNLTLTVEKPDINKSKINFDINEDGDISAGLITIKGVGEKATESIVANRTEFGNFTSIEDFLSRKIEWRVASIKVLKLLTHSGAFDSISPNRQLTWLKIQLAKGKIKAKDLNIIDLGIDENGKKITGIYTEDYTEKEKIRQEREAFGFLFEDNITKNKAQIDEYKNLITMMSAQKKKDATIGTINEIKVMKQKNGKDYARISVSTTDGQKEQWLIFAHIWGYFQNKVESGETYLCLGKRDEERKETFKVDAINPLEDIMSLS